MKILVTGCAGFIGSKVTELLLHQGHNVVGIDNLNNAYDVRLKEWRLSQIRKNPTLTWQLLDITDQPKLSQCFEKNNFESVINFAARAGVRQSLENPWMYYETNLTGTLNLLELCRKYGIKKFVLASTSSIYGERERPFREDAPTDQPISPYAASKKAAEVLCYTYHYLHKLDVSVLRYFTVFGPAGRPEMSIFRFIKWIAEGEPLALNGDGSQERDFTYVGDIAQGTVAALRSVGYEIINLGSDRPVAIKTIIAHLETLLGKKAQIKHFPAHPTDVTATWADISKAKRLLGWSPQTPWELGLQHSVEWYHQHRTWAKEVQLP